MTTVANIKGYINGAEWGVYEPAPSLLTYEEIVAMATTEWQPYTNTITELNGNAEAYYNMLNDWWHFTQYIGAVYITWIDINRYVIYYNYYNDGRFQCIQREKS